MMVTRYLHENNIAHRDIKFANILYNERTDSIKVCDFGLAVQEVNGNSIKDLISIFKKIPFEDHKPNLIIANTIKGSGISFIENQVVWHHKVPTETEFQDALTELDKQKLSFEND